MLRFPAFASRWRQSIHDIDALFDSLDTDGGGSLDVKELKLALKAFRAAVESESQADHSVQTHAASTKHAAEALRMAARDTEAFERAAAELEAQRAIGAGSVESRLGHLLSMRNMKVGEMVARWSTKLVGEVSRAEFKQHILFDKELGLQATTGELDGLFDRLDTDSSGSLDVPELRIALKRCQDAAALAESELVSQTEEVARLAKATLDAQRLALRAHDALAET